MKFKLSLVLVTMLVLTSCAASRSVVINEGMPIPDLNSGDSLTMIMNHSGDWQGRCKIHGGTPDRRDSSYLCYHVNFK